MWKKGNAPTHLRPVNWAGSRTNTSIVCCTFATRLRWVSIAPFDTPVVPPVYCNAATSSAGSISTSGAGSASVERKSPKELCPGSSPCGSSPKSTTIAVFRFVSGSTVFTRSYTSAWATMVSVPESFRMCSISRSTYMGLIWVTIAPLHPTRRERGRHLLYEGLQPPELEGSAVEAQRGLPAVLLGRLREQFVQRALEDPRLRLHLPGLVD